MATRYYEFQLDSFDFSQAANNSVAPTDWPLFKIGGKNPLENIAAIKILEVQIPFSWYVFNTSNNTFLLTETGQSPVVVTLPVGNYNATQMTVNLQMALTAASLSTLTYTVTYDSTLQKFSFYNNSVSTLPFSLTFGDSNDSGNTNPRNLIGFPAGETVSSGFLVSGTPRGNFIVAPNAMSVTGANYIYLNSLKIGNLTDMYLPRGAVNLGGGNAGPQMAKIPVNVQPGGVIFWNDPCPEHWFSLQNLTSLTEIDFFISLGNTSGQFPLKLNGQSFSLKLGMMLTDFSHNAYSSGPGINDHVRTRVSKR